MKNQSSPIAKRLARKLTIDEINDVSGGHPPGGTVAGTDCTFGEDGSISCKDHEHDEMSTTSGSFGGFQPLINEIYNLV